MNHTSTKTNNSRKNIVIGLKQFVLFVFVLALVFESKSQEVLSIGAGTSTQTYPFNYSNGYSRCAMIYTATEMGTSANAKVLTSIGFYCNTAANTGPTVIRLKLVGSVTSPGFETWATLISGSTQVYSGTPSNTTGYRTITLSTPFFVPAGQNVEILVETNYGGTGTGDSYGNSCRYTTGSSMSFIQANSTAPTGSLGVYANRPNVQLSFNPPAYKASITAINAGLENWCPGETRNVTVSVTNTGTATWTNSSPDINIGCKWNADSDYHVRCDANNLAPGASQTYTLSVTAPLTLGTNNLTFDVVYEACFWFAWNPGNSICGTTSAGNSVYTSNNQYIIGAPAAATNPTPSNAATNLCYMGGGAPHTLTWNEVANATSYDVYFGAGSLPSTVTSTVSTNAYSIATFAANTTYYWKVVAKNACGSATGSSTWTFTTGNTACYCTSMASSNSNSDITSITINGVTNTSSCGVAAPGAGSVASMYSNFTSLGSITTLVPGNTYSFSVAVNYCGGSEWFNWCSIYIDYNNNSDFADLTECIYQESSYPYGQRIINGSFTVPSGATSGTRRLRLVLNEDGDNSSCGIYSAGETEEYLVFITPPPVNAGAIDTTTYRICDGEFPYIESITPASGGDNNITYQWRANGVAIPSSNVATYSPSSGISTTTVFTRWAHDGTTSAWTQSTGSCTHEVIDVPIPGAISTTGETICYGGNPGVIGSVSPALAGMSSVVYLWSANGVDIGNTNSATYDPPAGLTTTTVYERWAYGCAWAKSTGSWTVTVRPAYQAGNILVGSETICYGGDPGSIGWALGNACGGDNNITYEWRANGTAIPSSNSLSYNPPEGLTATTVFTRWAHDGTCNTSWTQSSGSKTVTVRPAVSPGEIATSENTICSAANPTLISNVTSATSSYNGVVYQWRANGVAIPLSNSVSYDPPSGLTNSTVYTRWVHEGSLCNYWTQSSGSSTVTVLSPPILSEMEAGDYIWNGRSSFDWDGLSNWLCFNGSSFSMAGELPDGNDNVFIQSNQPTCSTFNPSTDASSTIDVNDINIQSGFSLGSLANIRVHGNWNNSGTFNPVTGTVWFIGDTIQQITAGGSAFNNIVIDNTSSEKLDISMLGDMTINGTLTLNNGILDVNGHNLIFGSSATVVANSTSSFVHGKMTKTGSSTFKFPCGDVVSRDLRGNGIPESYVVYTPISATPSSLTSIEVEYFFSNIGMPDSWPHNGNMDASLHHVSDREYWSVKSNKNLYNVTIYWNDNAHAVGDFCTHGFDDGDPSDFVASDLAIAYWSSTMWLNDGGTVTGNHDNGQIGSNTTFVPVVNTPTIFTLGSKNNSNPLPVELLTFTAVCNEKLTELHWSTASEANNAFFSIQKSSDSIYFEEIARVVGHGNSNSVNNYSFTDFNSESNSDAYYRLLQFDFDGAKNTLGTRHSSCNTTDENRPYIAVSPNPFDDVLGVVLVNFDSQVTVQIIDQFGQVVWRKSSIETNNLFLQLDELKPGVYYLKVFDNKNMCVKKIEKG